MAEHQVLNAVSSVDKTRIDDLAAIAGIRILDTTATQLDSLRELLPIPQADVLEEDLAGSTTRGAELSCVCSGRSVTAACGWTAIETRSPPTSRHVWPT
ncbi:hypothetical protein BJF84_22225 [Rhodococcus sp. CUA-806]|nr:hypothetical protein BJF84_22225 [Rhodococcus sp. CUA-806]